MSKDDACMIVYMNCEWVCMIAIHDLALYESEYVIAMYEVWLHDFNEVRINGMNPILEERSKSKFTNLKYVHN